MYAPRFMKIDVFVLNTFFCFVFVTCSPFILFKQQQTFRRDREFRRTNTYAVRSRVPGG